MLFISHDLSILGQACDRIMIMYAGSIVEMGDTAQIFSRPRHPYTCALLKCFPDVNEKKKTLTGLAGSPPDLIDPPTGCCFHPRCPQAETLCREIKPGLREIQPGQFLACHMELKG
jgi:oligopeptide/dipeptide ABC transporter ATP-binding protein